MPVERDYAHLEQIIESAAVGGDKPTAKTIVSTRNEVDSKGRMVHVTQTSTLDEPNIALAQKLLDQRIGGPQDFC